MSVKKVFVDTIKFAIDRDLEKSLSTLIMLQDFHKKIGIFKIGVNGELKHKKISELLDLIIMLGIIGFFYNVG